MSFTRRKSNGNDIKGNVMTRKSTLIKNAVEIVTSKIADGRTQKSIADELGVVSAHIWRLLNKNYLSPTLRQAMTEAGWLEISKRSPRISIQRDDPEAAAQSIVNLMDKETALALVININEHYFPFLKRLTFEKHEPFDGIEFVYKE